MDHSETIRALAEITDAGLFERLATAVLRQAQPDLYGNLSHPGMNAEGKTRRSPVDGIAYVLGADPPHMVVAHHASGLEDLKKKWLNEPAMVRKRGPKPTAPPGDIIKTISIAIEERKRTPDLRVTLALTTNQEPSEDVLRDAQAVAKSHAITIDPWSGSRIAHYLDNTAEGQWLRNQYLRITQERISAQLLAELSRRSLAAFPLMPTLESLIDRELDRLLVEESPRPVAFLVGESGFGKTIACYKYLKDHIEAGGYGLILTHETLAANATLDQALDSELRKLHSALEPDVGVKARALSSPDHPFLVMVEDINWADRPSFLLERLVGWASRSTGTKVERFNWRLLCPVWPSTIATATDEAKKRIDAMSISVSRFSESESRLAVRNRARLANETISGVAASRIAEELGHDPLLIALYHFGDRGEPLRVIGRFVDARLRRLSRRNSLTLTDCRVALREVAEAMLVQRELDPTWENVSEWFREAPDRLNAMRQIAQNGEVVRLNDAEGVERLRFRHDRVRAWLLSEAAAELMRSGLLQDHTLAEPFFADVIGTALAKPNMPTEMVERIRKQNPLALFYALKVFGEPETEVHHTTLKAIDAWLGEESTHERANRSLRRAALQVLAETESSQVISITDQFNDDAWSLVRARFRNGDLAAGIQLSLRVNPGATASWRDREIEHAKHRFGTALTDQLGDLLRQPELVDGQRVGALRLAGHFADPGLAGAISTCWANDPARDDDLASYLWAAAQCGGDDPAKLLRPICAAWAALPDTPPQTGLASPRADLGADELSWAFNEVLSPAAASYFVSRARRKDLRWPITLMLRGVNQPDAVEFIARVFAAASRSAHGFWSLPGDVEREWERRQSELGRPMSVTARQRLLDLLRTPTHDKHLRRSALLLWAATSSEGDLDILREIPNPGALSDEILSARIRRGDPGALPAFVHKLRSDQAGYWWQLGRYTWSDAFTTALEEELQRRGKTVRREWGSHYPSDWIVCELVATRLTPDKAEDLLERNWEHLHFSRNFIESALLIATPSTCALVAEAMASCPDPRAIFQFVQVHFQPKCERGPGLERIAQVEAFVPYLDWLDSHAIFTLWDTCNRLGWFAFRRQHLDVRLDATFRERTILDEPGFFSKLDEQLARGGADWADFLINRYLEQTDRVEDIIELLQKWLGERMTVAAVDLVAAVLRHIGVRRNLRLLSVSGIEPAADLEEIRADTFFAVSRRSLT